MCRQVLSHLEEPWPDIYYNANCHTWCIWCLTDSTCCTTYQNLHASSKILTFPGWGIQLGSGITQAAKLALSSMPCSMQLAFSHSHWSWTTPSPLISRFSCFNLCSASYMTSSTGPCRSLGVHSTSMEFGRKWILYISLKLHEELVSF